MKKIIKKKVENFDFYKIFKPELTPKRMMLHASSLKTSRPSDGGTDQEVVRLNLQVPIPDAFFELADRYEQGRSIRAADRQSLRTEA